MVKLLSMWREKKYRFETLLLAAYILDKVLAHNIEGVTQSDLTIYMVTSLILAAKIE